MSDFYPRYRHLYDDAPFSAELSSFVNANLAELESRCRQIKSIPANRSFDDILHDAVCLFVVGKTPAAAPDEVKAAEFVACFRRICIAGMYDVHKAAELRLLGVESDGVDE